MKVTVDGLLNGLGVAVNEFAHEAVVVVVVEVEVIPPA